jgi:hypothetical protein
LKNIATEKVGEKDSPAIQWILHRTLTFHHLHALIYSQHWFRHDKFALKTLAS